MSSVFSAYQTEQPTIVLGGCHHRKPLSVVGQLATVSGFFSHV